MKYRGNCCGVVVIGRVVWIALQVLVAGERCPQCGRWAQFVPAEEIVPAKRKAA